jgi:hypothetical protein
VESIGTLTLSGISLAMQASSAHIAAFVDGVARKRMTVTLAPVARAGIEAAANADFILSADSPDQMVQRHLQLSLEELRYPAKYGRFTTAEGTSIGGAELEAGLRKMLADSGPVRDEDRLATMSVRVLQLLGKRGPAEPNQYSQLSSISHGAATALGMFLDRDTGSFVVHREFVQEYTGYLWAASISTGDRLAAVMGTRGADLDRWTASRDRSMVALAQMIAMIDGAD